MSDGAPATTARVVVVGMGSEYRRDDGVGVAVADEVARICPQVIRLGPIGEPLDLLGLWDGADLVVVVDAVRSGAPPGTVQLIELSEGVGAGSAPSGPPGTTSTHGIGLSGVLRLARALDRAPRRVVVVGIEGGEFGDGVGLSPPVERAVSHAARHVRELVATMG